jgi:hypothetical protein
MALLLSVIVNEFELRLDKDIRKLLTLIAMISEPGNIDVYFDAKNEGFNSRYATYLKKMHWYIQWASGIITIRSRYCQHLENRYLDVFRPHS